MPSHHPHATSEPADPLSRQLLEASESVRRSAEALKIAPAGKDRLIALAHAYVVLAGLWRATLRTPIRAAMDVEKHRIGVSWAGAARLLAQEGVPISASQLRQCTIARTGGGGAARRRGEIAELLNPIDLRAWLEDGLSYARIAQRAKVSAPTVALHARRHGLSHLNRRARLAQVQARRAPRPREDS